MLLSNRHTRMCVLLFIIFLSLPDTVVSVVRSFSKLKYITNYLRNSMAQERLKGLALLNFEAVRAKVLGMDTLIDRVAETKERSKQIV